ncbi:MAG: HAD family hydrolase [Planctomycetota bacterium]
MIQTQSDGAVIRIAMWSGPRNISTALMRSFGNRSDAFVSDEPFYGHYLARTKLPHPGREAILASQPIDWKEALQRMTGEPDEVARIWYQKHMAHHLPESFDDFPVDSFRHAFLIRDPTQMLASLANVIDDPTVDQTGLPQQVELFRQLNRTGAETPPVLDADDVITHPEWALRFLCERLSIPFEPSMLSWPAGPRRTDGVWGRYWYKNVNESTGFSKSRSIYPEFSARLAKVLKQCEPLYQELSQHRPCFKPTARKTKT